MVLNLPCQAVRCCIAWLEDNECLDNETADIVRCTHNGGFLHRRVLEQGTLDFERPDAVPGCLDHIIVPSYEPEVAVFIFVGLVTGIIPVPDKGFFVLFFVIQVFPEEAHRAWLRADRYPAFLMETHRFAKFIMELNEPPRGRLPHGTELRLHPGERADTEDRLGLAVTLINRK